MAFNLFLADKTIPGLSAKDLVRRASDSIGVGSRQISPADRRAFAKLDRSQLRDLGLDRDAC